jgi:hypothetical protein
MSEKKRKWQGELAKPISALKWTRPHGYPVDPKTAEAENAMLMQARNSALLQSRLDKLPLLFEHYGIDDQSDFLNLSLALAIDFVPGFSFNPTVKTGRPRVWDEERLDALLRDVEGTKHKKGFLTDREAIKYLARHDPWKMPAVHRGDVKQWIETLESRLQEAKKTKKHVQRRFREILAMLAELRQKHIDGNSGNS